MFEDSETVGVWKHYIENDAIVGVLLGCLESIVAIGVVVSGSSLEFEIGDDVLGDGGVVFYEEDVHWDRVIVKAIPLSSWVAWIVCPIRCIRVRTRVSQRPNPWSCDLEESACRSGSRMWLSSDGVSDEFVLCMLM